MTCKAVMLNGRANISTGAFTVVGNIIYNVHGKQMKKIKPDDYQLMEQNR
jgi:hypothetical protein